MTTLPPGLELDRRVAELMGWTDIEVVTQGGTAIQRLQGVRPGTQASPYTGYKPKFVVPSYSEDIAAAWGAAVERELFAMYVLARNQGKWQILDPCGYAFYDSTVIAESENPAHAICLSIIATN